MAAVLNFKIFTKSTAHSLRAIPLAMFPPAFLMLLITGLVSSKVNPAIGILPLFLSATYSALLLANEKRCGCQSSGLTGTPIHLIVDLTLSLLLLTCLILTWVFLPTRSSGGQNIMLGTYSSNWLAIDFFIHSYFTLKSLSDAMQANQSPMSCPHCQFGPFTSSVKLAAGYAPLLDSEGRATTSMDAERAERGEAST
ncbi:hypothetical protein BS50DRAFT_606333 [Corynespora cassiicola Philippines]|uniref:MARVEL domain-containing protein n=1 Tax=Corynespora cassiicola Philippines TaxID=1448308 RepID=A0A2T2PBR8_CORCC|nr:hypothetical protein BS50DRAFT_606333 [Corynespora cassiicola Philippines]